MIASFGDEVTEDIFHGENSKAARRIPSALWKTACRKLDMLNAAHELRDSIRINDQFRIVFRWKDGGAHQVRITDYH